MYENSNKLSEEVVTFFTSKEMEEYKKGDIISGGIHISPEIFFIKTGFVKVYTLTQDGNLHIHTIYKSSEIFPLISLFQHDDRDVYYEAMTSVTVYKASKEEFLDLFKTDLEFAISVIQYLVGYVDMFFQRLYTLGLTSAYARVLSYLIFLSTTLGRSEKGTVMFDFPITQEDIAHAINITRETASKELNRIARKKLIQIKKKSGITISNIEGLRKELTLHYEQKEAALASRHTI